MLKWSKRIVLGVFALAVLVVAGGAIYEQFARAKARREFPPPGKIVDVLGRNMHLDCRGHGLPTVVLEAGLTNVGSLSWSMVHDALAAQTRTCAYDRAGIMWSDPKSTPHDGEAVANDLHALLTAAGEKGPYVMTGHSLGGPYSMIYTRLFPAEVAGVVFVDASHADQFARYKAAGLPAPETGGLQKLLAATTWMGWTRFLSSEPALPGMPAWVPLAADAYAATSMGAVLEEDAAFDIVFAQAGELRTLGDRPIVVLTMTPSQQEIMEAAGFADAQATSFREIWVELHDDQASWSTRSRHELVADAGHFIQFDRPDAVIDAVTEVVDQVRADEAKAAEK